MCIDEVYIRKTSKLHAFDPEGKCSRQDNVLLGKTWRA